MHAIRRRQLLSQSWMKVTSHNTYFPPKGKVPWHIFSAVRNWPIIANFKKNNQLLLVNFVLLTSKQDCRLAGWLSSFSIHNNRWQTDSDKKMCKITYFTSSHLLITFGCNLWLKKVVLINKLWLWKKLCIY